MTARHCAEALAATLLTLFIVFLVPREQSNGNVLDAVSKSIHLSKGPTYEVDQVKAHLLAAASGHVDLVRWENGSVQIEGWAANVVARKPVRAVLIFVNGRNVARINPQYDRPDVSAALAMAAAQPVGFKIRVTANKSDVVEVFAEQDDGSFSELPYAENR